MRSAHFEDILGDKAHRYRRVLIPLTIILIAIYVFPNLDFSGLSFFGIKPAAEMADPRSMVLLVLWVLVTYHAALFAYHAYEDWKDWLIEALPGPGERAKTFPEISMYFHKRPSAKLSDRYRKPQKELSWKYSEGRPFAKWTTEHIAEDPARRRIEEPIRAEAFVMRTDAVRSVRRRIRMFAYFDCGFPLVPLLLAGGAAIYDSFCAGEG